MTEGGRVPIPFDEQAERWCVACALGTRQGGQLALDRVMPDHFYAPQHQRLIHTLPSLKDVTDEDERIAIAATLASVPVEDVRRIVLSRPVQWDSPGKFASLVVEAHKRRTLMQRLATVHDRVARGEALPSLIGDLVSVIPEVAA